MGGEAVVASLIEQGCGAQDTKMARSSRPPDGADLFGDSPAAASSLSARKRNICRRVGSTSASSAVCAMLPSPACVI
jgi:hypothetical protein